MSFKEERIYKNPTEVISISSCRTVKSVEEELKMPNTLVIREISSKHRNLKQQIALFS